MIPDKPSNRPDDEITGPDDVVALWRAEIERGQKKAKKWVDGAKKIIERYRVEDKAETGSGKPRYNILWSNTRTMAPALYAKPPKALVQRRYLDKDPIARIACRILERAVQYQIDAGDMHENVKLCVLDRLLCGRGQVWLRYDPTIEDQPSPEETGGEGQTADDGDEEVETMSVLTWEMVQVDYVHWEDFVHEPGRVWSEVSWVARRAYMTRDELSDRFGKDVAAAVPLNCSADRDEEKTHDATSKAGVWELWNKAKKEVIWIADEYDHALDTKPDPLKLSGFFPCPKPLFATITTDSLVPVPDYEQYKGQAHIMDDTTHRIASLIKACRVLGVYDDRFDVLGNIFESGKELDLFAVEDWSQWSQANGFKGAVDFLPIDMFAAVIKELSQARAETKAEIYEITGLSDILRGQGDPTETATGVKAKSQFATLRLQDEQGEVARFVRDIVRIIAEITCEMFQPQTLAEMSSAQEMTELQIPAPQPPPPPQGPPPGIAPAPGGPPAGMPPQRLPMMAGAPA